MFGFSKTFVIVLLISVGLSYGMRNWYIGLQVVGVYAIAKIIWNVLTKKRR